MEIEDFGLMIKGFFAKRKSDETNFANVGFMIDAFATGLSGKKPDYKKFIKGWFGEGEKPLTKEEMNKRKDEIRRRVQLSNKILEEKEKNNPKKRGRRVKNNN